MSKDMSKAIGFAIPALLQLVPIILEFKKQQEEGIEHDVQGLAGKIGGTFGIADVDGFVEEQVKHAIRNGAGIVLDDKAAQIVADIVVKASGPVMTAVAGFAKGEMKRKILLSTLASVLDQSNAGLLKVFQDMKGIPDDAAKVLARRIGLSVVVLCCLAAAYRIFKQVMSNDELAQDLRADVEKGVGDAVTHLRDEWANLQEFVSKCALDALVPLQKAIGGLGVSILNGSDA